MTKFLKYLLLALNVFTFSGFLVSILTNYWICDTGCSSYYGLLNSCLNGECRTRSNILNSNAFNSNYYFFIHTKYFLFSLFFHTTFLIIWKKFKQVEYSRLFSHNGENFYSFKFIKLFFAGNYDNLNYYKFLPIFGRIFTMAEICLLYTSDAADE